MMLQGIHWITNSHSPGQEFSASMKPGGSLSFSRKPAIGSYS